MTQTRPAHPSADPEATEAPDRQCGRCRRFFPGGVTLHPSAVREWWACPPCREALLGARARRPTTS